MGIVGKVLSFGRGKVERVKKGKDACKNLGGKTTRFGTLYELVQDTIDNGGSAYLAVKDWCSHEIAKTLLARDPKAVIPTRLPTNVKAEEKMKTYLKVGVEKKLKTREKLWYSVVDMSEKTFEKISKKSLETLTTFRKNKASLKVEGNYDLNYFRQLKKATSNRFKSEGYVFHFTNDNTSKEITIINPKSERVTIAFTDKGVVLKNAKGNELFDSSSDSSGRLMNKIGLFLKVFERQLSKLTKKLPRVAKRKKLTDKRIERLTKMQQREERMKKYSKPIRKFLDTF